MKRIILMVSFMGLICSCVLSQQINIPEHDSIFRNFRKEIHKDIPGMPLGISPYADLGINLHNKDLFSGKKLPESFEYRMIVEQIPAHKIFCLKPVGSFHHHLMMPDTDLRYQMIFAKPQVVMTLEESEITEMVNRETRAWDTQNVDLLLTLFHPDMVWPWPKTPQSHDPLDWELLMGKFNRDRWGKGWQELFDNYQLVHNRREIKKIVISAEKDAAFAVVDIDTLWISRDNRPNHWRGRVCKVYSKVGGEWKMTMHTGVLEY